MQIAISGLGRMGLGISRRLKEKGHRVLGFDRNQKCTLEASSFGIECFPTYKDLLESFKEQRRVIWIMVPAGKAVDDVIESALPFLREKDIVIDGGNSYYKDSIRRYELLKEKDIYFLDIGTSGGIWGLERGFSLMVGGDKEAFDFIEPILRDLSFEEKGYAFVGASGCGHFVKMVHNAIEYGMMESIAEGLELLKESPLKPDLKSSVFVWSKGSVIDSWLIDLTLKALEDFGDFSNLEGYVEDTGEGRWTLLESIEKAIPMPSIYQALSMRFRSRQKESFRDKVLAALRYEFGRHPIKKKNGT